MIRWILFLLLGLAALTFTFWVYLRVELRVPRARRLALARALALIVILTLLFDLRLPGSGDGAASDRWVLLDASMSMGAVASGGGSAWQAALVRATELRSQGWRVVTFGASLDDAASPTAEIAPPDDDDTQLAPALRRAAEAGVRSVRVLSDLRLQDRVAVRAALTSLPLDIAFEGFGGAVTNAGISALDVPDLVRSEGSVTAQVEVHATGADSLTVRVFEEGREVAATRVEAPSAGLRSRLAVELPTPQTTGRVRYTASVTVDGDGFPSDDAATDYASVGHEEGAVLLVSLRPDWEPRYLLPVLQEVTGLPAVGYLRVGPAAFVSQGRAVGRGPPADSAAVRRAAADAAIVVVHGLDGRADPWARSLAAVPGHRIVAPIDGEGAGLAGISSGEPQRGEWYASVDVPSSPIAGALAGLSLQGLPPLTRVLLPDDPARVRGALLVRLRGAGSPEAAIHLEEREEGRMAVVLASGLWRWAAREDGREAYRRVWSGVAGWLLADETPGASEVRPSTWVVGRGDPVGWSVPSDRVGLRVVVTSVDAGAAGATPSVVLDTVLAEGGPVSTGVLPPGAYRYSVVSAEGDSVGEGRFDVAATTTELLPEPSEPALGRSGGTPVARGEAVGRPLRTRPWPYLLIIALLCGEWIGRRRSGLR